MKPNGWTPERRKRQAELIKNWKPWEHTKGPNTAEGKKKVSQNAKKHGLRSKEMKLLRRALKEQKETMEELWT